MHRRYETPVDLAASFLRIVLRLLPGAGGGAGECSGAGSECAGIGVRRVVVEAEWVGFGRDYAGAGSSRRKEAGVWARGLELAGSGGGAAVSRLQEHGEMRIGSREFSRGGVAAGFGAQ